MTAGFGDCQGSWTPMRTLLQVVFLAGALGGTAAAQPVIFTANPALSNFGGIVQVPLGPFDLLGSTFTLYVDGVAITAKSLPYVPASRCVTTGPFCWTAPGPVVYPPQLMGFF